MHFGNGNNRYDYSIGTIYYEAGKPYGSLPEAPEKEGYTFSHWYMSAFGDGSVITEDTVVTHIGIVYAQPYYVKNGE